jgi:L-ascorbate metabolism protein UlaG (beta-lactamase superfamily)
MYITWLDNNTWLWEINGKRVLVDPWLVGDLVFLDSPWFFKGENPQPCPIPKSIDLILLSQGLPDHAHPETLSRIDRQIPVVCSSNAVSVVTKLGYERVTELPHGGVFTLDNAIEIRAVTGAAIGPFLTENGYILTDCSTGLTLYYEAHGYPAQDLETFAPIDVVITPVVDLNVPVAGPIIQGHQTALEIAKRLNPQILLPTTEGGEVRYHGLLAKLLQSKGSVEDMQQQLGQELPATQFLTPRPGDRVEMALTPYRTPATTHPS